MESCSASLTTVTCVSVCVFPVTLLYFREVSVASPIANLLLGTRFVPLMLMLSLAIFLTGGVGDLWQSPSAFCLKLLYDGMMLLGYGLRDAYPGDVSNGLETAAACCASILILFVLTVICSTPDETGVRLSAWLSPFPLAYLLAGQGIYRLSEQRCFTVTILGQRQEEVVLVAYAGKTDVIDLTGDHRNPRYVQAYCAEQGIRRLDTLCLTKRADQLRVGLSADVVGNDRRRNGSSCQLLDSAECRLYGNKAAANGQVCRGGHPVQHPGIGRHTAGEVRQPLFLCRDSRFLSSGRRGRRSDLYPVERRPGANAGRNL